MADPIVVGWCMDCCSQHEVFGTCPGKVEPTEPEVPGRRFVARLDGRTERYQALVAPAGDLWRVRVVSLPDRLWSVPGGHGTANFFDADRDEAERLAALFVFRRCKMLGAEITELDSRTENETLRLAEDRNERHDANVPAMFGVERPTLPGRVSNVSMTGLFIATNLPEPVGHPIVVVMRFEHYSIPLAGSVVWVREEEDGAYPAGMGIELDEPPAVHRDYIRSLTDAEEAAEEAAEP